MNTIKLNMYEIIKLNMYVTIGSTLKHMPPSPLPPPPFLPHTHIHLHVCAVQKCVKVGQSDWCLVFEA